MIAVSADPEVMRFFPAIATAEQTTTFIKRMQLMYAEKGYCYFAVERLSDGAFLGFIGLCYQDFEASFTPCVDIGWRLGKAFWGHGYATEGAQRCLKYAFVELGLKQIKAIAPLINLPSIHVMQKIGMEEELRFKHPRLSAFPHIVDCTCYSIDS